MREVIVKGLLLDPSDNSPVILLKGRNTNRSVPIWVTNSAAQWIGLALSHGKFTQPPTHDLMFQMIKGLEAQVIQVVIRDLREGTYFASIFLENENHESIELDARASDSITLALYCHCPIFVADEVFEAAAIEVTRFGEEDEDEAFDEFIRRIDLREFRRELDLRGPREDEAEDDEKESAPED